MTETVFRVVRRRARPDCEAAYEAMVRAMFDEASRFPGYLAAELIPPEVAGGEYQIIQRFATEKDLDRWNASAERATWHERLRAVAASEVEDQLSRRRAFLKRAAMTPFDDFMAVCGRLPP